MVELAAVVAVLSAVALLSGNELVEWIGTGAVALSFCHFQVADRLAEREAARSQAAVDCHRWQLRYVVGKEVLWVAYFILHQSWTALVGAGVFLLYPIWRVVWRRRFPVDAAGNGG